MKPGKRRVRRDEHSMVAVNLKDFKMQIRSSVDLNNLPTAVGRICSHSSRMCSEDLNNLPTAVGRIQNMRLTLPRLTSVMNPVTITTL